MRALLILFVHVVAGALWRAGGYRGSLKPCRAVGVPLCIVLGKIILLGFSWKVLLLFIYVPILWGMMSLFSYGLSAPPHKAMVYLFGKGERGDVWLVEFCTRCLCGFSWSLAACVIAYFSSAWLLFLLYVLFLTLSNGFVGSSRRLTATQSEFLVGASVAMCVLI